MKFLFSLQKSIYFDELQITFLDVAESWTY